MHWRTFLRLIHSSQSRLIIIRIYILSGGALILVIDDWCKDHSKTKRSFWGALKKWSKCYSIICHFKLHSLHVCQVFYYPIFISVCMKYQVVLSTSGIFETIFIFNCWKLFILNWEAFIWQPACIMYRRNIFFLVQ